MSLEDIFEPEPMMPGYRWFDWFIGDWNYMDEDHDRVRVEFFTNERSIKEKLQLYFIKNQRSSLRIRLFNFMIKNLTCILYMIRVMLDDPRKQEGCACSHVCNLSILNASLFQDQPVTTVQCCHLCKNHSGSYDSLKDLDNTKVHWELILFVNRAASLWIIQVVVAILSLSQSCLITYLGYKGNIVHSLLAPSFLLECINTIPFIITTFNSERLKCLFIPVFLNCWLAKKQLEDMFGDLNRILQRSSSALSHRVMKVISTTFCLIFTSVCGVQHLQRGGYRQFTLFESFWFVMVTFSTVGYGDYKPDIWPSQVFMIVMIVVAITIIPTQLEKLAYVWMERNRLGATYSRHRAQTEKHVVVCTTALQSDTIMDFLNEFYAHPKLQDYYVCLLSPCELDSTMKMIMQVPIWAQRVIFIQGSALKDVDLARCRMQDAEACFILAANHYQDLNAADQHTIMRSWAVKDFAPHCPQYVQLYRPENKFHVRFAEHVVCEDEFKYALLANNTLLPGISTLVTLLLHTSRGQEGQTSSEEWQRVYGKCSGNEVYHIILGDSRFFKEYEGRSFSYASYHAHRKYGVSLVAVSSSKSGNIQLNPGPRHLMEATDTCFYLSITKEENTACICSNTGATEDSQKNNSSLKENASMSQMNEFNLSRSSSFNRFSGLPPTDEYLSHSASMYIPNKAKHGVHFPMEDSDTKLLLVPGPTNSFSRLSPIHRKMVSPRGSFTHLPDLNSDVRSHCPDHNEDISYESDDIACIKGFPPVIPYIGTSPCLCHLMKVKRPICCLQLIKPCEHFPHQHVSDYNWKNRSVIVFSDSASYGLFNFVVPLRSHWRSIYSLKPIILLLEKEPDTYFLESISYFPLIYWILGSIERLDDLLKAGITLADNVVIVNKETSNSAEEDALSDCNTIVAVQTIYRLFPQIKIITELSQSSNMRFTLFSPDDKYALSMSKVEKKERARGSHISYIFRLPFAAGNVFSANMLDTLLYQAFVKSYLIKFVRLLLGIDQAVGSGHLTCCHIREKDLWIKTYGRLYQRMCSTTCEIPIGIYRTVRREKTVSSTSVSVDNFNSFLSGDGKDVEKSEIFQMVKSRILTLGLRLKDYNHLTPNEGEENFYSLSYVITNPNHDLQLQSGDIVYLIRPSSLSDKASPLIDERKNLENQKLTQSCLGSDKSKSLHNINKNESEIISDKYSKNLDRNTSQSLYSNPHKFKMAPDRQRFVVGTPQNSLERIIFQSQSFEKIFEDSIL